MSRLTELVRRVEQQNPALAKELASEIKTLTARREFGLNFERHIPETFEMPQRKLRRGDKVRFRASRGESDDGLDTRTWIVADIVGEGESRTAYLVEHQASSEPAVAERLVDDLVAIAEFRDPIYPGLKSTGKVERGGDKPYHVVINGENYHALEALLFAYEGKVDCIYIDPPYNTRDKDWKYNNDFVDTDDAYRHSKWLAMMERRLKLSKRMLIPNRSVLLVTIDDNELHRLGLLIEQVFPGSKRQIVSVTVSPRGRSKANEFSQVDEYLTIVYFGNEKVVVPPGYGEESEVRWRYLRRNDIESARGTKKGGPRQFYPIYVDIESCRIVCIGEPLTPDMSLDMVPVVEGATAVFPIREDGVHMNWGLTGKSLQAALSSGFVRVTAGSQENQPFTFAYLTAPNIKKIDNGTLKVAGTREDGSKIVVVPGGKSSRPTTVWRDSRHDAGAYGTTMLGALIPGRKFPFPKSLYAVEDALRFFVGDKLEAIVLDFFAGSGTTAHAVMRLNRQDGGRRRTILVTNNEVSTDEAGSLRAEGWRPGDAEWEQLGICEYITAPRITAAITGRTPEGELVVGDYTFPDRFPMADGFLENAEYSDLTYQDSERIRFGLAFPSIAPLLWMKAGSEGRRIDVPSDTYDVADTYGILFSIDAAAACVKAIERADGLRVVYIVTDDEKQYQMIASQLPQRVQSIRLYESYLRTFRAGAEED